LPVSVFSIIAPTATTISNAIGFYANLDMNSNIGTITNVYGILSELSSTSAGTITNSYGAYFKNPNFGSTVKIACYLDNASVSYNVTPPTNGLIVYGNTGIGTSSPICGFQVRNGGNTQAAISGSGDITNLVLGDAPGDSNLDYSSVIRSTSNKASNFGSILTFYTHGGSSSATAIERASIDLFGNVIVGTASLLTNASDGFLYIPTCAGTPTGTPTSYTGRIAMIYDTNNNRFFIYNGAWKGVTLT
jgi:hypothetical protein